MSSPKGVAEMGTLQVESRCSHLLEDREATPGSALMGICQRVLHLISPGPSTQVVELNPGWDSIRYRWQRNKGAKELSGLGRVS